MQRYCVCLIQSYHGETKKGGDVEVVVEGVAEV